VNGKEETRECKEQNGNSKAKYVMLIDAVGKDKFDMMLEKYGGNVESKNTVCGKNSPLQLFFHHLLVTAGIWTLNFTFFKFYHTYMKH